MLNLISIIHKNFKILSRSKLSAAAIIITPLLIVLLAGTAFNSTSLEGIEIGVHKEGNNNVTDSILSDFKERGFQVIETSSEEDCKRIVKEGDSQICLIFPKNFSNKLNVYADNSRMDVAYFLINEINSKVASKSSDVGEDRASELLNTVSEAKEILVIQKGKISELIGDLNLIISKGGNLSSSLPQISLVIEDLEEIEEDIGSIDTEDSVSSIKSDIESVISSLPIDANSDMDEIVERSEEAKEELEKINYKINEVIQDIGNYEGMNPREISSPISTEINSLTPDTTNWKYLFPTFLSLVVLFGSLILGSVIVMREKKSNAYFRNFITSTSEFVFFMGIYLTCLILLFLQIGVVFGSLAFIINMPIYNIIWKLLLITLLSGTIFIFLGMFIGYLFNSEETIVLTSISLAALSIFFSNIILPAEAISGTFKKISIYSPLVITNSVLRKITLFNMPLNSVVYEIGILGIFLIVLFILAFGLKILTKRRAGL